MKISLLTASALFVTAVTCHENKNIQPKMLDDYETASKKLHLHAYVAPKDRFVKIWNMPHTTLEQKLQQQVAFKALEARLLRTVLFDVAHIGFNSIHILNIYDENHTKQSKKQRAAWDHMLVERIEAALEKGEILIQCEEAIFYFTEQGDVSTQNSEVNDSSNSDLPVDMSE